MGVISVDTRSRRPIYEQLVDCIRENVLSGALAPSEQLPSVRALAGELAINPNTIQKSYNELERLGIIYSLPGRGSFVSENISELERSNREKIETNLKSALCDAKSAGFSKDELIALVNSVMEELL